MITCQDLGRNGRLGNQMFQFASTLGIASKAEQEVFFEDIPETVGYLANGKVFNQKIELKEVFPKTAPFFQTPPQPTHWEGWQYQEEPSFMFSDEMFKLKGDIRIRGYFQSEKYFEHIKETIRNLFEFSDEIKKSVLEDIPQKNQGEYWTAIHVRGEDYKNLSQFHPPCSMDYYSEAIGYLPQDKPHRFLIFSDDMSYAQTFFDESENVHFIAHSSPYEDLFHMTLCDHFIIANSSFSWWGAWLSKNDEKVVVAPRNWFGEGFSKETHDTRDLYCKNWIQC